MIKNLDNYTPTSNSFPLMVMFAAGFVTSTSFEQKREYRNEFTETISDTTGVDFNKKYTHIDDIGNSDHDDLKTLTDFAKKIETNSENLSTDFQNVFDENIWEMT